MTRETKIDKMGRVIPVKPHRNKITIETIHNWVEPVTESGCWLWLGALSGSGYGQYQSDGPTKMAHRTFYELYRGAIPPKMTIDHLCRVRCCVNPDHLEAVPNRTNVLRGISHTAVNARKTHCVNGREFTESNTFRGKDKKTGHPTRRCRECNKRWCSEYEKRRKART